MKTLSDSGPLVRLLSVRWQLPCNLLVNELPKMTHCWILLAPSGQLFRFWDTFAFSWCGRPRALAFPSSVFNSFSQCHLFYYDSFPVLVKSQLLIYITTNVFPTGSSPPVGDFQQKLLPPRTIQPLNYQEQYNHTTTKNNTTTLWYNHITTKNNYFAANQPNNKTSTLSHKTSDQQSYHTTHTTN